MSFLFVDKLLKIIYKQKNISDISSLLYSSL